MGDYIRLMRLAKRMGITNRLRQFKYQWTNGQAEVTNKIIKQATTKQFYYATVEALKQYLMTFLLYYNHQKSL